MVKMVRPVVGWLSQKRDQWTHMDGIPWHLSAMLYVAVFLMFSVIGFYTDLINGGTLPYLDALALATITGLNAVLWVVVIRRLRRFFLVPMLALQFVLAPISRFTSHALNQAFHPASVPPEKGLAFAATAILIAVIVSYTCFTRFMAISGRETSRIRNELALAHSIQKTLVPAIDRTAPCFEIYGVSFPSEKVGGDLVDVVELPGGDTVAYLADIAGHGLQAGILMGMLKTAARMALADPNGAPGPGILSQLMVRLNFVLPQVKEAHMYATLTALRLNRCGEAFYGMAASPPLLHWSAVQRRVVSIEEQQFPLGLLPVAEFPASPLAVEPGDLLIVATDGILEVAGKGDSGEFGVTGLERVIAANAELPLTELAKVMLEAAREFGQQFDDQTLLLVRRTVV